MLRKIIKIDEDKCNGCGQCISGCAEGALALINGKAKLVKDNYCDGFGDCIGTCPTGALTFEEREADTFDPEAVKHHVHAIRGAEGVKEFEEAHQRHAGQAARPAGGCPGSMSRSFDRVAKATPSGGCPGSMARSPHTAETLEKPQASHADMPRVIQPEIQQWPVQLHLVPPAAPYFHNKELVLMSTCGPLAAPDVNWRFVRGRGVAVACPKLDRTEGYVEKIADIIKQSHVPKVIVVRMTVPCCGGLSQIAVRGAKLSGRPDIIVEEVTVGLEGAIESITRIL
ncbi:MAG: 4Fe-4S binding protein [Lentisphaeria bacterium]|nr:4Fe-4S binding protein [Lentisphaeria bacterium]